MKEWEKSYVLTLGGKTHGGRKEDLANLELEKEVLSTNLFGYDNNRRNEAGTAGQRGLSRRGPSPPKGTPGGGKAR